MATEAFIVPTDNYPFYSQRTDLNGVDYQLEFEWSTKELCWYLSVSALDGTEIWLGIKLVVGVPLLRRCTHPLKPQGDLVVNTKIDSDDSPPGIDDLLADGRCELVYVLEVPDPLPAVPL